MHQAPFSEDLKDQIRMSEAGGYIALTPRGVVFQFDSNEDFKKYMEGHNQ